MGNESSLVKGLIDKKYDIVFLNHEINVKNLLCKKSIVENLYVSVPKMHFVAQLDGVHFKDIDRQSFLMSASVGVWGDVVRKNMPNSRFLLQNDEDLAEVASSSTLPTFATDIADASGRYYSGERVNIPILDDDAHMTFYMVCLNENANKYNRII